MCGICGIIDWNKNLSDSDRKSEVLAMNKALNHRGPDEAGNYSEGIASLAMSRLAIIDQEGGSQPIFNAKKTSCIVFNGEIYNYRQLKQLLIEKGHSFKTESDTEVLLALYELYGFTMLHMLKGMFSFCIYNIQNQTCFLARDPFGEKPLYYQWDKGTLVFSSEINSLLQSSQVERNLNHEALPYYLRTSLVPEPITLLKNVMTLRAGHYMIAGDKQIKEEPYFDSTYPAKSTITDEVEAIETIRPFLENAVKRQTVSDVPIGAFLSGGIDSSIVVALLQQSSSKAIKTFNVKFEQQEYDESSIARKVADFCGTDHHEITIPNLDFDESIFWKIIDHVGLPFRDSSAIPSFMISQEISKHVKVALSGDGGDELFGGYDLFQWYQKIVDFKKVPRPIRQTINAGLSLGQNIPILRDSSALRKVKRGVNTSLLAIPEIPIALNEMFIESEVNKLLGADSNTYPLYHRSPEQFESWSPLRKIMHYRLMHTLPGNMLVKVDRMSMANSLEVRAPFLDADLFAVSTKLSDELLIKEGKGKYILRKLMKDALPSEVFSHPKTGFNMPLYKYQNEAFNKLAYRLLFDENPWPGFIDHKYLEQIYHRGIHTKTDNAQQTVFQASHQLWMLMQLFGWATRFNIKN